MLSQPGGQMEWTQVLTIVGVNVALVGLLVYLIQKIDSDVKSVANRLDGHATRIDQLYSVILEMLKKDRK